MLVVYTLAEICNRTGSFEPHEIQKRMITRGPQLLIQKGPFIILEAWANQYQKHDYGPNISFESPTCQLLDSVMKLGVTASYRLPLTLELKTLLSVKSTLGFSV